MVRAGSERWWLSTRPLLLAGRGCSGQRFVLVPLLGLLLAGGFDPGEDAEQELLEEERGDRKEGAVGQISWGFTFKAI